MMRNDIPITCANSNIHDAYVATLLDKYTADKITTLSEPHALIAGPGYNIFGHWLVEHLPKIWLLERAGFDVDRIKYIIPSDAPSFVPNLLALVGISEHMITRNDVANEVLKLETLIVPSIMHDGVRFSPLFRDAANYLMSRIRARFDVSPRQRGRRIFIVRPNHIRAVSDREKWHTLAKDHGFELVSPELMPLAEQVRLMGETSHLAGEYGSGLHLSVFSPPGLVVTAIRGSGRHPAFLQSGMGDVLGHKTGYLFGTNNTSDLSSGFSINEKDLMACLRVIRRLV